MNVQKYKSLRQKIVNNMKSHTNSRPFKHKRNNTCPSLIIPNVYLKSIQTLNIQEKSEIENLINDEIEQEADANTTKKVEIAITTVQLENIL